MKKCGKEKCINKHNNKYKVKRCTYINSPNVSIDLNVCVVFMFRRLHVFMLK